METRSRRSTLFGIFLVAAELILAARGQDEVVDLQLVSRDGRIHVAWEMKNSTNAVTKFLVTWHSDEQPDQSCLVDAPATDTSSCDGFSLRSCAAVTVAVQPLRADGSGIGPEASDVMCPGLAAPPDVSCSQEEDLSLKVHWTAPSTTCEISQYSVNYTAAVIWSEELCKNYSLVDAATLEYVLQRPIPYTFYIFEVRAVVKGCGPGEPRSCPLKTKEEPPSAPVSLKVTANTAKSLSIAWKYPTEMNGDIKDFIIRWYPNNQTNDFLTTDQISYTIGSLTPCTEYNVTVAARNAAGEGTPAQTHGATITIAPDHLVCVQNAEDLSLKVRWDAPNPVSGCTVVKYDIATTIDVIWSGETFNNDSSVDASTTQYVVDNPVSYSNYTFGVSAVAAGDVKGMTVNCGVTTAQTAPSAPENLALLEARSDALVVQWDAPAELNGVVVSYLVSSSRGGEFVTNQTLAASPEQTRFNCTVDGLTAATDYDITVRAVTIRTGAAATSSFRTSGVGQGSSTSTTTTSTKLPTTKPTSTSRPTTIQFSSSTTSTVHPSTDAATTNLLTTLAKDNPASRLPTAAIAVIVIVVIAGVFVFVFAVAILVKNKHFQRVRSSSVISFANELQEKT
ncbi:neogenin-like [Hyalella azteca]|uniref:Neogenin-like n=1 Tax=Hyalella azteca TaxID=294128 RepID=A0A979FID3_HYAAZ|nr:neogenin-like [Hyalella azteca]